MIISQINEIFCITIFLRKQIINKHLIRKSLKKINKAHHSVNYVNLDTNEKSDLYKEKSELNKQTEYQAINAMRATSKRSGSEKATIANTTHRTKIVAKVENRADYCSTEESMRKSVESKTKYANFDKELAQLHNKIFKRNSNNLGNISGTSFPIENYKSNYKMMSLTNQKKGRFRQK